MESILKLLENLKPGVDFAHAEHIIDDQLLVSMEVMMLVSLLNDEFDIRIPLPYIRPENFQSVQAIYDMVQEIEDEE